MTNDGIYWENDWHCLSGMKYNNDNLMWRYWVAKEIAKDIIHDVFKDGIMETLDTLYIAPNIVCEIYENNLTQLLKKEWFRK